MQYQLVQKVIKNLIDGEEQQNKFTVICECYVWFFV